MIHARDDYNRIQDPENKIPQDEPVVLFRGQDAFLPDVLEFYIGLVKATGKSPEVCTSLTNHLSVIEAWQRDHGKKIADLPGDVQNSMLIDHSEG